MEGPYSARLPSSSIGETSRRAPVGRGTADGRAPTMRPPGRRRSTECFSRSVTHLRSGKAEKRMTEPEREHNPSDPFTHEPVMLNEILDALAPIAAGVV